MRFLGRSQRRDAQGLGKSVPQHLIVYKVMGHFVAQARDGFVQRLVTGVDKSLAFAAFHGTLLGCVKCAKTISDEHKKLWSGELTAVSAAVIEALRKFVNDTHYTGGESIRLAHGFAT